MVHVLRDPSPSTGENGIRDFGGPTCIPGHLNLRIALSPWATKQEGEVRPRLNGHIPNLSENFMMQFLISKHKFVTSF